MPKKSDYTPEEYLAHLAAMKARHDAIMADPVRKEVYIARRKKYVEDRKEVLRQKRVVWRRKNAERLSEYERARYYANHEKIRTALNEKNALRHKTDVEYRLRRVLSARVRDGFANYDLERHSAAILVGCTMREYREHIERTFEVGMTWGNYGKEWHVDHIYPIVLFDLAQHANVAFNYRNTRAMWAKENWSKNCKLPDVLPHELYVFITSQIEGFTWNGKVQDGRCETSVIEQSESMVSTSPTTE